MSRDIESVMVACVALASVSFGFPWRRRWDGLPTRRLCRACYRHVSHRVPNAISGRDSFDIDIYGMEGVPDGMFSAEDPGERYWLGVQAVCTTRGPPCSAWRRP